MLGPSGEGRFDIGSQLDTVAPHRNRDGHYGGAQMEQPSCKTTRLAASGRPLSCEYADSGQSLPLISHVCGKAGCEKCSDSPSRITLGRRADPVTAS